MLKAFTTRNSKAYGTSKDLFTAARTYNRFSAMNKKFGHLDGYLFREHLDTLSTLSLKGRDLKIKDHPVHLEDLQTADQFQVRILLCIPERSEKYRG